MDFMWHKLPGFLIDESLGFGVLAHWMFQVLLDTMYSIKKTSVYIYIIQIERKGCIFL